jgi:hypothetical protein
VSCVFRQRKLGPFGRAPARAPDGAGAVGVGFLSSSGSTCGGARTTPPHSFPRMKRLRRCAPLVQLRLLPCQSSTRSGARSDTKRGSSRSVSRVCSWEMVESLFFSNYTIHRRHSQRTHTHPYEYTHTNPTPRSIFEDCADKSSRLTKSPQTPRCRQERRLSLKAQTSLNPEKFAPTRSRIQDLRCYQGSCDH